MEFFTSHGNVFKKGPRERTFLEWIFFGKSVLKNHVGFFWRVFFGVFWKVSFWSLFSTGSVLGGNSHFEEMGCPYRVRYNPFTHLFSAIYTGAFIHL